MRPFLLLVLGLAVSACATPPDRYDAFTEVMRGYANALARETERAQTLDWPDLPPDPQPAPTRRGRRAEAPPPRPPAPDCSAPATLSAVARERCNIGARLLLLSITQAHGRALADYFATLRTLATRLTGTAEQDATRFTREEVFSAGARLQEQLGITDQDMPAPRSVEARVGLRPAFGSEMSGQGWRIRQQMDLHSEALARLEALRAPQTDATTQRLRWAFAYLRSAFEALILSDHDAIPEIEQARRALGG